jgi:hypothetical protein
MKEKLHWMFPLYANHLQHLYLILCNDVDCTVIEVLKKLPNIKWSENEVKTSEQQREKVNNIAGTEDNESTT